MPILTVSDAEGNWAAPRVLLFHL